MLLLARPKVAQKALGTLAVVSPDPRNAFMVELLDKNQLKRNDFFCYAKYFPVAHMQISTEPNYDPFN